MEYIFQQISRPPPIPPAPQPPSPPPLPPAPPAPPPPDYSGWRARFQEVGNQALKWVDVQQTGQTMQNAFRPCNAAVGFALGSMIQKSREFESQTRKAAVLTAGDYGQAKKAILDMAKDSVYSTGQVAGFR